MRRDERREQIKRGLWRARAEKIRVGTIAKECGFKHGGPISAFLNDTGTISADKEDSIEEWLRNKGFWVEDVPAYRKSLFDGIGAQMIEIGTELQSPTLSEESKKKRLKVFINTYIKAAGKLGKKEEG